MFACWADAAAEAVEALVRVCSCEPPFAYLASCANRFGVEVEALDLSEDGAKLDVVSAVSGNLGVETPIVEVQDRLLHGIE
jgi:hypothetical protein